MPGGGFSLLRDENERFFLVFLRVQQLFRLGGGHFPHLRVLGGLRVFRPLVAFFRPIPLGGLIGAFLLRLLLILVRGLLLILLFLLLLLILLLVLLLVLGLLFLVVLLVVLLIFILFLLLVVLLLFLLIFLIGGFAILLLEIILGNTVWRKLP